MLSPDILRKKADFDRIYRTGQSVGDRYLVVFRLPNHLPFNRTAFLASKKVGNSVARNRARRLMKESFRLLADQMGTGFDLIIIARVTINGRKCADVKRSLHSALMRIGVIQRGG